MLVQNMTKSKQRYLNYFKCNIGFVKLKSIYHVSLKHD